MRRQNSIPLVVKSESFGSCVEVPPCVLLVWVLVTNSQVVGLSRSCIGAGENSRRLQTSSDLESDAILDWVSWIGSGLLVNNPTLVGTIVALVPDEMSVLGVGSSMNIKTSVGHVSNSSSVTFEPSDLLDDVTSPLSDNTCIAIAGPVGASGLDGEG